MNFPKLEPREIASWGICNCGAITVEIDGKQYSMEQTTFEEIFEFPIPASWFNCNHCVNHWGIDLCACGSGTHYDECTEDYSVCGDPMQVIGSHTRVRAEGAWI